MLRLLAHRSYEVGAQAICQRSHHFLPVDLNSNVTRDILGQVRVHNPALHNRATLRHVEAVKTRTKTIAQSILNADCRTIQSDCCRICQLIVLNRQPVKTVELDCLVRRPWLNESVACSDEEASS